MAKPRGLWIAIGGGTYADAIERTIETQGQFTLTVTTRDISPRSVELVAVALKDVSADYIGISEKGRQVATAQMTLAVSRLVPVPRLSLEEMRRELPRRLARRFNPPKRGQYRISPGLWEAVLQVLSKNSPELRDQLNELRGVARAGQLSFGPIHGGLEIFERDAVASALETWRGAPFRKRMLRSARTEEEASIAPFLSRLGGTSVREDPQISHDHTTFPGMEVARRDQVGSLVLRHHNEYLTILNCNRQPLEETLGVDLIYYNHQFDSFVLVQYKRMKHTMKGPVYRPNLDSSHTKELQRMVALNKELHAFPKSSNSQIAEYRLSQGPFYIKLCEPKIRSALDTGMVSGMYIPLTLWRRLLRSDLVRGKKGGVRITWENCMRRFSNTEFTNLLRHGWIGSAAGRSKHLTQVIESVLANGKMLVLAATTGTRPSKDYRRDTYGRFAADDDPAGAI